MRAYEGLGFERLRRDQIRDATTAYLSYLEYNPSDGKSMRLLGDAYGRRADSIGVAVQYPGVAFDPAEIDTSRRQARAAQLAWYERALVTWQTLGLEVGRGSDRMLRETLEQVLVAARDLGELDRARRANDTLLVMEGLDPEDAEAVLARGSPRRRGTRLSLALEAILLRPPEGTAEERRRLAATRRRLLADAGLDPAAEPRTLLSHLAGRYEAHLAAGGADDVDRLMKAQVHLQLEDDAAACALLVPLAAARPEDPNLARLVRERCRR
jgi:hypothetical protein